MSDQLLILFPVSAYPLKYWKLPVNVNPEMCWEKILPNKRRCSRRAHSESAVNTPLVTEQMTETVHTTSLWLSWNGKSGKPLFMHKPAHACIQMCLENHFLFINSYTHIQVFVCVCISYTSRQMYIQTYSHSSKHDWRQDWLRFVLLYATFMLSWKCPQQMYLQI